MLNEHDSKNVMTVFAYSCNFAKVAVLNGAMNKETALKFLASHLATHEEIAKLSDSITEKVDWQLVEFQKLALAQFKEFIDAFESRFNPNRQG